MRAEQLYDGSLLTRERVNVLALVSRYGVVATHYFERGAGVGLAQGLVAAVETAAADASDREP